MNDEEAETGGKLLTPTGALDVMMRPMKTIGLGSPALLQCKWCGCANVIFSGFGRADHSLTVNVLKRHFTDYTNVVFTDED